MAAPTVASLVRTLGEHLAPAVGSDAPETEVSAVHISELPDPTGYLSGGELLLTTGLTLPANAAGCAAYVGRLVRVGVVALGLGLGPTYAEPPRRLVTACRQQGLPLLVVPGPTPFTRVTRAYWRAATGATARSLTDALAVQRALVDAASTADPIGRVLTRLARSLDGWAAVLTASGEVESIRPSHRGAEAQQLRAEIARLEVAGIHSAASFVAGDRYVAVFPLTVQTRAVGYLAVGTHQQIDATARRTVLTAAALLSLVASRAEVLRSARDTVRGCVATLLDLGLVDAARRLALELAEPPVPELARVVAVRSGSPGAVAAAVAKWCPDAHGRTEQGGGWYVVPADRDPASLRDLLVGADGRVAAVVSARVRAGEVAAVRLSTADRLAALSAGTVELPGGEPTWTAVGEALERLQEAAQPALVEAVASYLRNRGHWEAAARDLGLHRNTLRYRVERARERLGLDLDDPDLAARLWLAMRERRLA